jgi:hypothetical protein
MRKLGFGLVEGPWGARVPEAVARALDKQRRELPAEFRDSLQRFTCKGTAMALGDRQEDSWISTDTIDRQGDVVLPLGMDDRAFALNPVVTWQHAYDQPPVGLSLWRRLANRSVGQGILARTRYPMRPATFGRDQPWLPDMAWNLLRQGLLAGKSIGFVPIKVRPPTPDDLRRRPDWAGARRVITDWLLVEYACVTLPANPETLLSQVVPTAPLASAGKRLGEILARLPQVEE